MHGPMNTREALHLPTFPVGTFGQCERIGVEIVGVGIRIITSAAMIIGGIGERRP